MSFLDRPRAERIMAAEGLDALILLSPESFRYATGAEPGVATMWRAAGAVAALVPCDTNLPAMAVASDLFAAAFRAQSPIADLRVTPIWVETATFGTPDPTRTPPAVIAAAWATEGRAAGFARPTTFDPAACWRHLADALAERGLARGRIGVEMAAISARDWPGLAAALPGARLCDATEAIARLKMVKTPAEVGFLRDAVTLAEVGLAAVRDAIAPGVTRDDLSGVWKAAVAANRGGRALSGAWDYISVGPDPWGGNRAAAPGDLIKVDVGCVVRGYTSDSGRTFVLGPPSALQARLFDALAAGFAAGMALLGPGAALAEIHRATTASIRGAGFPGYTRGHFGHSLGTGPGSEDWPFIAADSPVTLEPGMVMAFECPWYVTGLGGMIIENQLLITETGAEAMNALPLGLVEIGV
ncbi:MAG: M24 family metallopeptidase [Rhodobacteraceae bacterium]|nr:M24 family metallopeptidase [Paracoccaceae bacterium]